MSDTWHSLTAPLGVGFAVSLGGIQPSWRKVQEGQPGISGRDGILPMVGFSLYLHINKSEYQMDTHKTLVLIQSSDLQEASDQLYLMIKVLTKTVKIKDYLNEA